MAPLRSAVVSADVTLRELVLQTAQAAHGIENGLELPAPVSQVTAADVSRICEAKPDLLFLDLSSDPVIGIELAQHLGDELPHLRVIAAGPSLSTDLLLAAMRAGVVEYLPQPVTEEVLGGALARVVQKIGRNAISQAPTQPCQIIAFYSAKGGSGSTTAATNFAIALRQQTGKRTLILDLDPELGEVALLLRVQPRFTFVDMAQNLHRMDAELLASYLERHSSGVDLLSAPFSPERSSNVTGDQVRAILQFLRQHYDYIVLDLPKSFSASVLAAATLCDLMFLVTTVDLPSVRNIQRALPLLKQRLNRGEEQLRLIINRHQSNPVIPLAEVERTVGLKIAQTLSNDYDAVARSINTGRPIVLNGNSPYTRDIKALTAQVANMAATNGSGRQSLTRKVLGRISGMVRTGGNPDR